MAASTTPKPTPGLVCPECGKIFARPQGLASHRRQAHGVIGSSAAAARRRLTPSTRQRAGRASTRRAVAATAAPPPTGKSMTTSTATPPIGRAASQHRTARRGPATRTPAQVINHDSLLALLYPNGIPAREEVLRSVAI